jgi:Pyruvate/2-oxoacid:ferredoxin oxidoreductase gamma subunit
LPGFEVKELPLTDADGKIVNGRRLEVERPRYMTTAKWISEQTDDELRKELERFKVDIHLSEQNLLNKRITQGSIQRELREREHAAKMTLRAVKVATAGSGISVRATREAKPSRAKAPVNNTVMANAMMKAMELLNKLSKEREENKKNG